MDKLVSVSFLARAFGPRRFPGRERRGFAAVFSVMLAGIFATAGLAAWRIAEARELVLDQAFQTVRSIEVRGFTLHHWLHDAQKVAGFNMPAQGEARRLAGAETDAFNKHETKDILGAEMAGPNIIIEYLVARPDRENRAFGIMVIRNIGTSASVWETIGANLARRKGIAGAELVTAGFTGFSFNPATDYAVYAFPFARINEDLVLREERSGWTNQPMVADINMGRHELINTPRVQAATITPATIQPVTSSSPVVFGSPVTLAGGSSGAAALVANGATISGSVGISNALTLTAPVTGLETDNLQVAGDVDVGGQLRANSVLSETVRSDRLESSGSFAVERLRATSVTSTGGCNGC